jgi:hypothetical protein
MTLLEVQQVAATTAGGTIAAIFTGGRLTLTGDAADNSLLITQGADGRLILSGNGSGTGIRLNGDAAGGTVTLPAAVTGPVMINLGDGLDNLFIDGVQLPGALSINGGNGTADGVDGNLLRLHDVRVGGSVAVSNLAGMDATYLLGSINVRGGLSIRNGSGGSQVWGDQTTDLHVGGILNIANGAGYDQVDFWGAINVAVAGISVNSGSDADGAYLRIHPFGDLKVAGGVRVVNGAGSDMTDLGGQNVTVHGAVVIRNGDGGSFNTMLALGTLLLGQVAITNGAGDDTNDIFTYDAAVIRGGISFNNAAGDSSNYVGGGSAVAVVGNISVINGTGRDINTIFSDDIRISGAITVRNGDGDSDTSIGGTSYLLVQGATKVTAGIGLDEVTIGAGRLYGTSPAVDVGPVRVNVGDGGSDTQIRGGRLAVHGPVSVDAGAGTDRVLVSTESANGTVAGNLAIDIGAGDEQWVNLKAAAGRVLTVGGSLGIWTDNPVGLNWIDVTAVDVKSWTEIWTGDGSEQVRITGSTFRGTFDLNTEGGNDEVLIELDGAATYFRGRAWFDTGDGDDQVLILGAPNGGGWEEFGAATTWDGGAGTDTLAVPYNANLFFHQEPSTSGFETAF